jgi:hypothetical protein
VSSDEFERTMGNLANDADAALIGFHRDVCETHPPAATRSAERDAAAPAVAKRLHDVEMAFAAAAITLPVRACECCTAPELIARLESVPAMELSEEDVANVVGSLTLTLGSADDIPYFVPRWCADGLASPLYDVTMAFSRMAGAGFAEWSSSRRSAVRDFLKAQLRYVLSGPPIPTCDTLNDVTSLYQCMAYLGYEWDFFAAWGRPLPDITDEHLAELLGSIDVDASGRATMSDAWRPLALDTLETWLRGADIAARLASGVALHPAPKRWSRVSNGS